MKLLPLRAHVSMARTDPRGNLWSFALRIVIKYKVLPQSDIHARLRITRIRFNFWARENDLYKRGRSAKAAREPREKQ